MKLEIDEAFVAATYEAFTRWKEKQAELKQEKRGAKNAS